MIFLDTNVVSETLKREPEPRVLRWLTEHDAELVLPKWLSELHESVLISARIWNSSVASGQLGQLGQEQLVVGQLAAAGAGPAVQEAEALISLLCRPRGPRPQNLCDAAVSMVRFAGAAAPCAGLAPEVRSGPCRLPLSAAMRTAVGHV